MRDALAANSVGAGEMREFNVGTAEITDHVFVFLPRASALHHDVVARFIVAAVVADDRDDGYVVSRHGPQRIRLSEKDRKSTRLNSSHSSISYAVFCLKKKK